MSSSSPHSHSRSDVDTRAHLDADPAPYVDPGAASAYGNACAGCANAGCRSGPSRHPNPYPVADAASNGYRDPYTNAGTDSHAGPRRAVHRGYLRQQAEFQRVHIVVLGAGAEFPCLR